MKQEPVYVLGTSICTWNQYVFLASAYVPGASVCKWNQFVYLEPAYSCVWLPNICSRLPLVDLSNTDYVIRGHPFMMPTRRGQRGGLRWTHVDRGEGALAPCRPPHRKLKL